jgi:hypothetical protein
VFDRAADHLDGELLPTRLVREYAEQMQRIGMVRIRLQDLSIEALGFAKTATAMVLHGCRE